MLIVITCFINIMPKDNAFSFKLIYFYAPFITVCNQFINLGLASRLVKGKQDQIIGPKQMGDKSSVFVPYLSQKNRRGSWTTALQIMMTP